MAKKVYIGGSRTSVELPSSYTLLDYIEFSGSQYVDTGFIPTATTKMECELEFTKTTAQYSGLYESGAFFMFGVNSSIEFYLGNQVKVGASVTVNSKITITMDASTKTATYGSNSYSISNATYTPSTVSLTIGALATSSELRNYCYMKLYSYKLYDNNELVRNFIPCKNASGTIGLYDKVEGKFYANKASTAFESGAAVSPIVRDLPSGYTQVEYLESSGTQYIDTGFIPNNNTRLIAQMKLEAGYSYTALGARTSATSNAFAFGASKNGYYVSQYGNTSSANAILSTDLNTTDPFVIDKNKHLTYFNGDLVHTATESTFNAPYPMTLFAVNNNGTISNKSVMSLYYCQIYDDGIIVRDFVPCKNSSNVLGLYDLVNDMFYTNAGTGEFTAGSDISSIVRELPAGYVQREYIESNGTQYIDTGFKPNQNTKMCYDGCYFGTKGYNISGVRNATSDATNRFGLVSFTATSKIGVLFGTSSIQAIDLDSERHQYQLDKNGLILDGTSYGSSYSGSFTCTYAITLFAWNEGANGVTKIPARIYSCQIYDSGTLVRDFVPCTNPSGVFGFYDVVNNKFYGNSGTGTFSGGLVVKHYTWANVALPTKEIYIGVSAVARQIQVGYLGVNAVARQTYLKEKEVALTPISTPTQKNTLTYTGSAQSPTWNNYDSSKMTISGTTSGTNAGTYYATFTPKEGYCWTDGSTTAKSVSWGIGKKLVGSIPSNLYISCKDPTNQTVSGNFVYLYYVSTDYDEDQFRLSISPTGKQYVYFGYPTKKSYAGSYIFFWKLIWHDGVDTDGLTMTYTITMKGDSNTYYSGSYTVNKTY